MTQVFRDQHNRDGHDQHDRMPVEDRRRKLRQSDPRRIDNGRKIDRLGQPRAVGEKHVEQITDDSAKEDRQPARKAGRPHCYKTHGEDRRDTDPRVERACGNSFHGDRREIEPDHRNHRAGHDRRHQPFDPLIADEHDGDADRGVEHARAHDAAERNREVGVEPTACVAGRSDDDGDKGEARSEITRNASADGNKKDQRADARKQNRNVGVEAHQQRCEHGGAEHRNDVLQAEQNSLRRRQAFVGGNHAVAAQGPAREIAGIVARVHGRPRERDGALNTETGALSANSATPLNDKHFD